MAAPFIGHAVAVLTVMASLLVTSVFSQTTSAAVLDFDCRRQGSVCLNNGSCDVTTGQCDCQASTLAAMDYKCGDNSPSGTCTPACDNGAVCVGGVCNCGESYYGDQCQMNRVQVNCDGSNMFLNVNPDVAQFEGSIFVVDFETSDCSLTPTPQDSSGLPDFVEDATNLQGHSITLPHSTPTSTCGDVTAEEVRSSDNGTVEYKSYKRRFMVRYNNIFKTSLDQVISAECRVSEGGTKIFGGGTLVNETNEGFTNVDVNTEVETVSMYIHHGDGSRIDGPVMLGEDIQLVFQLAPASGFKDFYITSCEANNTDPNLATVKKLEFINDKCPSPGAFSLFRSSLTKEPATSDSDPVIIRLNMEAFMFMGSFKQVAFVCDIVLCGNTGEELCQPRQCDGVVASQNATDVTPDVDENDVSAPDNNSVSDNSTLDNSTSSNSTSGVFDESGNSTSGGNSTENTVDGLNDLSNQTVANETQSDVNSTLSNNSTSVNQTEGNSGAGDTSLRRRRRSTTGEHQTASTIMTVYGPGGFEEEDITKLKNSITSRDCMAEPEIVACIAILSTAVVFLLTVAVVLTVSQMRGQGQRATKHKVNVDCTPPLDCMRIPRLEMHQNPYSDISNQRC